MVLLTMGMKLVDQGAIIAGPPCSLFVSACASVHKRSFQNLPGNLEVYKVRLANRIWLNFACFLLVLHLAGRKPLALLEQPASSWAFKQTWMVMVSEVLQMKQITTWMAFYGHDMHKCSHLLSNWSRLEDLARTMYAADRIRFQVRFRERQRRRKTKKIYKVDSVSKSGKRSWQGGKDLASSAAYTPKFCQAMYACWAKSKGE
ncbi:unnamed protein product [Effrenium voratum]|nr:unnamed protein product [Effrenium voratum]